MKYSDDPVVSYRNALCLPCSGCEEKPLYPHATGGVFDQKNHPVADALLRREYRVEPKFKNGRWDRETGHTLKHHQLIVPGKPAGKTEQLQGKYIFAGYLFPHFGHFLLESLANLWFIKRYPDVPIIWLGVHNQPDLNDMNKQFIELYDIKNPIHVLTRQTRVEELLVPRPGYLIHTRYTKQQVEALKVLDAPDTINGKKVWLSRSALDNGGIDNEGRLEEILDRNGWSIFHPEKHCIADQLNFIADAEIIAGMEGSAFHQLVMIPGFKGEVVIFARRRRIEFDFITIAETLNLNQTVHYPEARIWSHGLMHWEYCRILLKFDQLLEALGAKRSQTQPVSPPDSLHNIVASLTRHFQHDLCIEFWAKHHTIGLSANCETLIVSESISFDTTQLPNSSNVLDIPADQLYTINFLTQSPDLICFRHQKDEKVLLSAFLASMERAKSTTLWVIEYYADERSVEAKNTVKLGDRQESHNDWLLKFICHTMPTVSIARVKGANAALVWRTPRPMLRSTLQSVRDISEDTVFERAPILSLQEIANEIVKNRK